MQPGCAPNCRSSVSRRASPHGDETLRTHVFDLVRGYEWQTGHTGRAVRNDFLARWHGREDALKETLQGERARYQAASREGDCDTAVVWASEAVDLIAHGEGAAALVERIVAEAEAQLRRVASMTKAPGSRR